MRIERGQHAVDRALDQRLVGDVVDIIRAHPFEHIAEQVELFIGLGVIRRVRPLGGVDILVQGKQKDRACSRRDQPQSLHSLTF